MQGRDTELLANAEARLGTVLRGKYRLDRVLGVGGMAVVYKATHRNQAEFAVKMLHPEVSLSPEIRQRFLREGYAANSIKHPGAVLVVDDDVSEDGAAFLVMELLDGVGCDHLWTESAQRVPPVVAAAILVQLLDVLAAAHDKGIVHRDIKPANLFLTRGGVVKVLDFGIARAREAVASGSLATANGMLLGTPAFMAPEQAMGKSRQIDGRADLWAAGATLFALVSGQLVHEAETVQEMTVFAATRPARRLASVAEVPPALSAIVDRALAFAVEDRWPSARAMRDALLETGLLGGASPESIVASVLPARPASPPLVTPSAGGSGGGSGGSGKKPWSIGALPTRTLPPQFAATQEWAPGQAPSPAVSATQGPLTTSDARAAMTRPEGRRSPLRWALPLILVVGSVLAAAGFVLRSKGPPPPAAATPTTAVDPSPSPPRPLPPPELPSVPPLASEAPSASAAPVPVPVPVPVAPAHGTAAPKPAAHSQKPAPVTHVAPKSPDCDPPYTLDEMGQKHFKHECFAQPNAH